MTNYCKNVTNKQASYIERLANVKHAHYALADFLGISVSKACRVASKADASRLINHLK